MTSGLYDRLTKAHLLILHEEVDKIKGDAGKLIRPQLVPFIAYPYEWSFSQLKASALATLEIQKLALEHGMTLRDASAYNIQLVHSRPCLIDTLSFEEYKPGQPWQAYHQFCQHFLAPLALAALVDPALLNLARIYIDGVPLPLASRLLPLSARLRPGLGIHLGVHAKLERQHESSAQSPKASVSRTAHLGLIDSLARTVQGLNLKTTKTEWVNYYNETNYSSEAMQAKLDLVAKLINEIKPQRVLDLGANDGRFSRIAAEAGATVISADVDPLAVEANYRRAQANRESSLYPVVIDLTNPSPALGWANRERDSFRDRAQADLVLALALIHHLAISNNVPLEMIADYFAELGPNLVIEFVPKLDSQVQRLLATREDIFDAYTPAGFEAAFAAKFKIVRQVTIKGTERTLYFMQRLAA